MTNRFCTYKRKLLSGEQQTAFSLHIVSLVVDWLLTFLDIFTEELGCYITHCWVK